jgi:uncharacterized membrane protein
MNALTYLLLPLMAGLLVTAQATWGSAIKSDHLLSGSIGSIVVNLASSWKIWLGAALYILATLVYFMMLTKFRFFSVQVAMTGISIIFSVLLAFFFFKEHPSIINVVGVVIIFIGALLVMTK